MPANSDPYILIRVSWQSSNRGLWHSSQCVLRVLALRSAWALMFYQCGQQRGVVCGRGGSGAGSGTTDVSQTWMWPGSQWYSAGWRLTFSFNCPVNLELPNSGKLSLLEPDYYGSGILLSWNDRVCHCCRISVQVFWMAAHGKQYLQ